ncbi:MAG: DUF2065 domain-containing protein [Burkholderiaceae bacterium]
MSGSNLLAALGLMLLFEGLMPFLAPGQWRELFARIATLRDGQIRFMGLAAIMLGLIVLMLV